MKQLGMIDKDGNILPTDAKTAENFRQFLNENYDRKNANLHRKLKEAVDEINALREAFYADVFVPGDADEMNPELEKALRVADFIELGQLMAVDALNRNESCGGHFREEYQDAEGETLRDDENFKMVAAWEYQGGDAKNATLHKEALKYEFIKIAARNYK
jgi:succinate dehydrogenase / fumarate reductase flavoprotein subunit